MCRKRKVECAQSVRHAANDATIGVECCVRIDLGAILKSGIDGGYQIIAVKERDFGIVEVLIGRFMRDDLDSSCLRPLENGLKCLGVVRHDCNAIDLASDQIFNGFDLLRGVGLGWRPISNRSMPATPGRC